MIRVNISKKLKNTHQIFKKIKKLINDISKIQYKPFLELNFDFLLLYILIRM